MSIRNLRIFVTVCEEGSMTKAGKKLFMAQPTISVAIAKLEEHYGVKLFDRLSNRLHLTDAGNKLLPYAQHIITMVDEMEARAQNVKESGTLRIGSSITIGNRLLPNVLKAFAQQRSGVDVNVQIANSRQIEQAVANNRVDLGLIEGATRSPQLIREPFWEDELVLLFARDHPWEAQATVRVEQLQAEPFLAREEGSGGREILESALLLHDIKIEPIWESVSTQAIVQAVVHGIGWAVLPLLLVEPFITEGAVVTRPIEGISLKRNFAIIQHENKYITDSMRDFIDLCTRQIGS